MSLEFRRFTLGNPQKYPSKNTYVYTCILIIELTNYNDIRIIMIYENM